ncbi:hypothetical protein BRDCF_p600 [Bacteroidales bacterium CF]|nr:hypothetical protein BRDCF_p600 [Bacteroidales bacterium CF]
MKAAVKTKKQPLRGGFSSVKATPPGITDRREVIPTNE